MKGKIEFIRILHCFIILNFYICIVYCFLLSVYLIVSGSVTILSNLEIWTTLNL